MTIGGGEPAAIAMRLTIETNGGCDGGVLCEHQLIASSRFLAATAATHLVVDTDIPGFDAGWRISFPDGYFRSLSLDHAVNDELTTVGTDDQVGSPHVPDGVIARQR